MSICSYYMEKSSVQASLSTRKLSLATSIALFDHVITYGNIAQPLENDLCQQPRNPKLTHNLSIFDLIQLYVAYVTPILIKTKPRYNYLTVPLNPNYQYSKSIGQFAYNLVVEAKDSQI